MDSAEPVIVRVKLSSKKVTQSPKKYFNSHYGRQSPKKKNERKLKLNMRSISSKSDHTFKEMNLDYQTMEQTMRSYLKDDNQ